MSERHNIMDQSRAWEQLGDGIPDDIQPRELRALLHAYNNVLTTIVGKINEALDAIDQLEETDDSLDDSVGQLERRIFDGETGIIAKLRNEFRNANAWVVRAIVVALVGASATFITIIVQSRGNG